MSWSLEYLSLIAFKSSVIKLFHALSDDIREAIENVAKKTRAEINSIENDRKKPLL